MEYDVFISYSSKDDKETRVLISNALEGAGITCWYYERDRTLGKTYDKQIAESLPKSKILLLLFSNNANQSDEVATEVSLAKDDEKIIVRFNLEEVSLSTKFSYNLNRVEWLNANPMDVEYAELITEITKLLNFESRRSENKSHCSMSNASVDSERKQYQNEKMHKDISSNSSEADSNKFEEIHKRYSEYKEKLILDAEAGNNESRYILGRNYFIGNVAFEQSYKESYKWIKVAADEGYLPAIDLLGWIYYRGGLDEGQNFVKAFESFKKAADQGYQRASMQVASMSTTGTGCDQNLERAVEYYTKANAYAELGVLYEDNLKDFKKAEFYYKAAVDKPSDVCYRLGMLYWFGVGREKPNFMEARKWLGEAAKKGSTVAKTRLGGLYYFGRGFQKDDKQAYAWYEAAARSGDRTAQYTLGWFYWNGVGVEQNDDLALEWFLKAAEQGDKHSQHHAGSLYLKRREYDLAFKQHEQAAEQGQINSLRVLGDMYALGLGCKVDHGKSVDYYQRAAEQGDIISEKSLELQSMPLLEV